MAPNKTSLALLFVDKKTVVVGVIVLIAAFTLGILIGYFGKGDGKNHDSLQDGILERYTTDQFKDNQEMIRQVIKDVSSENLRKYHMELTKAPHIAGLKRDQELTSWIKNEWEKEGLDKVDLAEYDFYLTWPNSTNPNYIRLFDVNGNEQFKSHYKEEELREGDDHKNFVHAFNAYAPAGTVTGHLVYVNYARVEDLRELEEITGVENFLEGKICIARYGKIYRGNKVHNCQSKGAKGAILFSDPADVAVNGVKAEDVYPNTIFLPGTGVQRGSTFIGDGDPLSHGWPSVPNSYREKPEDNKGLPKIPAQPIGYADARKLLEKMGGKDSPATWKGGMEGIAYKIGGEMLEEYAGWTAKLEVHNYGDTVKSSNVIGYITGSVEPDRYVMLSNHRDAWGYGSVDPSSATAQLMEVVRTFAKLKRDGWRPRRTIIFASWAAEEYGLEGSYEWVEQHITKVMHRTVGMVNTDICVSGPIAKPQSSPVLRDIVVESLKQASDPTIGSDRSYYEYWDEWTNQDRNSDEPRKIPKIKHIGSGTDHAAFAFYAGVPAYNLRFKDDTKKYKGVGQYPMYHTGYETFYLVDKIIDPGFRIHRTCAQTSVHAIFNLADSAIIPYNLVYFPKEMKDALNEFDKPTTNVTETLRKNGVTLTYLKEAVDEFETAAKEFMNFLNNKGDEIKSDPLKLRMINDQLMQMEKVFLIDGGIPLRDETRHAIFAPGKFNIYGGGAFPAISDLLYEHDKLVQDTPEYNKRWDLIKRHVSDLMIMTQNAARYLQPYNTV